MLSCLWKKAVESEGGSGVPMAEVVPAVYIRGRVARTIDMESIFSDQQQSSIFVFGSIKKY
jgi:hypothetical protein